MVLALSTTFVDPRSRLLTLRPQFARNFLRDGEVKSLANDLRLPEKRKY
jgi:hypothetical protein